MNGVYHQFSKEIEIYKKQSAILKYKGITTFTPTQLP